MDNIAYARLTMKARLPDWYTAFFLMRPQFMQPATNDAMMEIVAYEMGVFHSCVNCPTVMGVLDQGHQAPTKERTADCFVMTVKVARALDNDNVKQLLAMLPNWEFACLAIKLSNLTGEIKL